MSTKFLLRIIILFMMVGALNSNAQEQFIGTFNGHETVYDAVRVNSYTTICVGNTSMVSESNSADALIFARHDNGTILWSRVISSPNNDIFTRVKLMPNGNVIAMGKL